MISTGNSLYTPVSQLSALQLMVQTLALFCTLKCLSQAESGSDVYITANTYEE